MRSSVRMIATAAFTVLFMPGFFTCAEAGAQPSAAAKEDGNVVYNSDPAAPVATLFDTPMTVSGAMHYGPPKIELFLGYSYLRAVPSISSENRLVWLNGGSTSVAFNLNRYLGIVGDFGGFNDTELNLTGSSSSHAVDSSGIVYTYLFGPRLSFRKYERITPFVQALFGGVHASEVTLSNCTGICTLLPAEDTFAMTAGGGLDIKVRRHLAIRVIQAEYLMTRFENRNTGANGTQNDMRLSSGIVFRFGGHGAPPAPPLTYACSANPSAVFPGDAVAVSGAAMNLNPARTPVYTWSADGVTVSPGASNTASINTANLAAGTYAVRGHVTEGGKPSESADCTASITVKSFEPPTVSCTANPSSILPDGSAAITASGVSPQNRTLTYSYSAASGSVSGTGSTAVFSAAGATLGAVAVTCNVVDDKGQTASAGTSVVVEAPAAPVKPVTSGLCALHFERDGRRPARVDNEAKACLDEIALTLQRSSDAKLAIIGNASGGEKGDKHLAAERAVNAKAYLVSEKGIDASRVAVYTGSQDGKMVSDTLIPAGATLDTTGDTPVDESVVRAH
jgi:outer membrane protein OmpA-like peptidoglycan-associated protein